MRMGKKFIPINVVGSSTFGRYPKISASETINMYISDNWLIPTPGYTTLTNIAAPSIPGSQDTGRGIFNSIRFNKLIVVIDNEVYSVDKSDSFLKVGEIDSYAGDVFIAENDAEQIAICDKADIYIFDYSASTFEKISTDFKPVWIDFQNGYFLSAAEGDAEWRLSELNNGKVWPAGASNVGKFQTKPDNPVATIRMPGKGNHLLVMGSTVTELWVDVGTTLFPYERVSSFNIDYGCASSSTIAAGANFVVWLGINEKSGASIFVTDGASYKKISSDGIDFRLEKITNPNKATAFLFEQDGHLFYQLTFYDPADNYTFLYDFNTEKFFRLTDENMDYHIIRKAVYFNNQYYATSINNGQIYKINSDDTEYNGQTIPRIRVCDTTRLPNFDNFVVSSLTLITEQGYTNTDMRIDLSVSYDGGVSFTNYVQLDYNKIGLRRNKVVERNLGCCNEFTPQFRFWGNDRFLVSNGGIEIRK